MPSRRAIALLVSTLTLALAGCGVEATSPSLTPSARAGTSNIDLSAIACASNDPTGSGDLTGAWSGDDGGVYYIRQVGDCVWWFGTELRDVEPGVTGQPGFANVATGRVDGTKIVVEWADVPMGNILNGGGLTLVYDQDGDRLEITERRGDGQPFGATSFVRIEPDASPDASPIASSSP